MQPPQAPPVYQFGDFELDAQRRVLSARASGEPVDITGRVLEALVYLVERAGQLVEKKALIEALWPHVVVEDGSLTQTIHTLRRVLGETAGEHRYIATVPGRGYRFVAEVRVRGEAAVAGVVPAAPAETAAPARRRSWVLPTVAALLVLLAVGAVTVWRSRGPVIETPVATTKPSIAVLPFVDMSAEQDQLHFAEGLSEEILNMLARSDNLRVIARTSSFSFRNQNADIPTIAKRLAVTHVLEGSVRKSGDRIRVTAQLIDTSTSAHLWSDTFDRDLKDIFGVQSEIASAVAQALHVTLSTTTARRAETNSPQAYEHYLQGRLLFYRRSATDMLQAESHFEKAIAIDPEYGRAWAALAGVYLVNMYERSASPPVLEKWRVAVERAVKFAPDLAESHVRAAQYYLNAGDRGKMEEHLDRARQIDPHDPLLIGRSLGFAIYYGRLDEAIRMQRGVVENDPLSATNRGNFGLILMAAGQYAEAESELGRSLELSPAAAFNLPALADVLILQRRFDEALKVIARIPEGAAKEERLALAHFARGEVEEGNAMLARLIASARKPDANADAAAAVAEVYASRNDVDRAFEWLDTARARARKAPGPLAEVVLVTDLQLVPYLASLRGDPRWRQMLVETDGSLIVETTYN